ncbi:hypothetical protein [Streptomyces rugosispiralis]|uniref:Uncharacterized protein n=1 Tax=Streptomyces rugosispiralis TaxID=2967341 RepID=A0ABT1UNH4_9ACTN|nr:hypothetical protein [Streptomyces rugosispiralis]MCQ8186695.1 hypothetical protein [Streptomyces rugosispiralis]
MEKWPVFGRYEQAAAWGWPPCSWPTGRFQSQTLCSRRVLQKSVVQVAIRIRASARVVKVCWWTCSAFSTLFERLADDGAAPMDVKRRLGLVPCDLAGWFWTRASPA